MEGKCIGKYLLKNLGPLFSTKNFEINFFHSKFHLGKMTFRVHVFKQFNVEIEGKMSIEMFIILSEMMFDF